MNMHEPNPGRIHAPPRASAMVEALRGLGYSPSTAIADIIDNSIAAGATRVDLRFEWCESSSLVSIADDGVGMDREELIKALRLGDRSPNEERAPDDLGRFGLGLKTASFSQARRLTVASAKNGKQSCFRWDLDELASSSDDGWYLLEGPAPDSACADVAVEKGTLVIWERLDRIVSPGFREQDFLDLIDVVHRHLSMVFHRYLAGPGKRLVITINGRPVSPWDPFLENHSATWSSPVARLRSPSGNVDVQCHVLPHKDRLDDRTRIDAGGPDGWTSQQGFYVYRNRRLLVVGSWLGLGRGRLWTKEEAHRLARIRIDIPNTADADWKIDIRKSIARPPVMLREHLTRLAEDTRERARRVFAHRGSAARAAGLPPVALAWQAEQFKGGVRYRIDREHPAVKSVLEDAGELSDAVRTMLRVIEETVPVQRIWLDTAEARETPRTGFADVDKQEILAVLTPIYRNLIRRKGLTSAEARSKVSTMEPFHLYPEVVSQLPEMTTEEE